MAVFSSCSLIPCCNWGTSCVSKCCYQPVYWCLIRYLSVRIRTAKCYSKQQRTISMRSRVNTLLPISAFAPARLCSRATRSGSATRVTVTPMSREGQSLLHGLDLLLTSFLYHSNWLIWLRFKWYTRQNIFLVSHFHLRSSAARNSVPPVNLALSAQFSLPHTRSTCVKRILLNLDCGGRKHAEVLQNHVGSSLKLEKLLSW
jgi:hypothetical protein